VWAGIIPAQAVMGSRPYPNPVVVEGNRFSPIKHSRRLAMEEGQVYLSPFGRVYPDLVV